MAKVRSVKRVEPKFGDIKNWYEKHLHPDANQYDDQEVYQNVYHEGRYPLIFQVTGQGAQRLFTKAKPKSIVDIAALTAIYRPGPIASRVPELWTRHAESGERFDWGHPLFGEVLKDTNGFLIFQEQMASLLEVIADFPKERCDDARRALLKRDASKQDAAQAEAAKIGEQFIEGAVKKGVPEHIAREAFKKIMALSGYAFNKSHSTAYAIDSYMTAWLFTKYPTQWLVAYLESQSGDPDKKAAAFSMIKSLGYKVAPIDVNSATLEWCFAPPQSFMPSFLSIKGCGSSAVQEILANRPYRSVEELLWNPDGTWRHSRFNKRAMEALIKAGAFQSMDLVGEGKLFATWKQFHHVVIEQQDEIKKTSKKDMFRGQKRFYELIKETASMEEWTIAERAANSAEVFGSVDISVITSPDFIDKLTHRGVKSIDTLEEGSKEICWFVLIKALPRETKHGKKYIVADVLGQSGKTTSLKIWKWDGTKPEPYSMCIAEVDKNDYGCSTSWYRVKRVQ